MHFTVYCLDHPDMVERRLENYDAHKAYLQTAPVNTLISGPLAKPDGQTMIGSFFLYEADDIGEIKAFVEADPFNKAGIWATVDIRPFIKRVDNR
ncbi:YciI family protein [Burkholderia ambifaria]|uniref:YciI family protein n=1 Tax=Burkholderia ambifaria TaxID=152480 RepID=UPI0013FE310C|nr:YciI family protein [Burkholderia ambifaria]MBR8330767.1 YciI family protein [Burkholderia ambifaria]MBR8342988.1 YciI family protein [Burkholderia ambifaria]NHL68548.1 YciI family protein [Burkholderia ambifaria]